MTDAEIIEGILLREGPGVPPYLAKDDAGGRTSWGISERSYPQEWVNGPPSKERARAIYEKIYVEPFEDLRQIDEPLRVCCIDDAVMSGVNAAIKRLQHVLNVPMDGKLGSMTVRAALVQGEVLKKYVVERAVRITRLVERRPSDLTNLTGWITRILGFLP